MIGQKVTATVDWGGLTESPGLDTYAWSISGALPFEGFVMSAEDSLWTALDVADASSESSCFAQDGTATFSVTAFNHASGIEVPLSKLVTMLKPVENVIGEIGTHEVAHNNSLEIGGIFDEDGPMGPEGSMGGYFHGTVDTPASHQGDATNGWTHGLWQFVQVLVKDIIWHKTVNGQVTKFYDSSGNFNSGKVRLDGYYPYGNDGEGEAAGPWPAIGGPENVKATWDTPHVRLDALNTGAVEAYRDIELLMYVFYRPNGVGSQWVPIVKFRWGGNGKAKLNQALQEWELEGTPGRIDEKTTAIGQFPDWDECDVVGDEQWIERQ